MGSSAFSLHTTPALPAVQERHSLARALIAIALSWNAPVARARRTIDAWWPAIEPGAEAVVPTASGCGACVKEFGDPLRSDPVYADKTRCVSALARDLAEVIAAEPLDAPADATQRPVAVHGPCTLQHAQRLGGSAARRRSGAAAQRRSGSAARQLGSSAARQLGGAAARRRAS